MGLSVTYTCDNCGAEGTSTLSVVSFDRTPLAWFNDKVACSDDCFWALANSWFETRAGQRTFTHGGH